LFWIGHRYNRNILESWPINRHPDLVVKSEAFFARHGDKSVFIARFVPGVRAFIPLIAGVLGMRVSRFTRPTSSPRSSGRHHTFFPQSSSEARSSTWICGRAACYSCDPLGRVHLDGNSCRSSRVAPWHSARVDGRGEAAHWAGVHDARWSRPVIDLLDPSRPDTRALALLAVVLIGSAWLFFGILEDVVSGDPLVRADTAIYNALQDLRTAPGDAVMIASRNWVTPSSSLP
jgi:undecaprenyl-diphosphatase